MATYSNPMVATRVGSCQSSLNGNANPSTPGGGQLNNQGERVYKVQSRNELSRVEQLHLDTLHDDPTTQKFSRVDVATIFKGLQDQLEFWPMFFHSKEECGREIQQGIVMLWSNYLIAETLLASISIQPLVTVPDAVHGWRLKLYGFIWMMSVICDFVGIAITGLFLGFLLGCPSKASWHWMCKIGWMRSIPSILVLLDLFISLAAIAYTCWVVYGYQIGIVSLGVEAFALATFLKVAAVLIQVGEKIKDLQ